MSSPNDTDYRTSKAVVTCKVKSFLQRSSTPVWNNRISALGTEIISEDYCSSRIFSNMLDVAEIVSELFHRLNEYCFSFRCRCMCNKTQTASKLVKTNSIYFRRAIVTGKLVQTDLVFGVLSGFISRSVHAWLQLVSVCSGYDLLHPD